MVTTYLHKHWFVMDLLEASAQECVKPGQVATTNSMLKHMPSHGFNSQHQTNQTTTPIPTKKKNP
jgi:hypothetical protein